LEQLSFTSRHIKSSVVIAASFPFQQIKKEKKSSGKKRYIKDLVLFLQENHFKPKLFFCVRVCTFLKKAKEN